MSKFQNKKKEFVKKRDLVKKTDDTEYAIVTKILGAGKFMVKINMEKNEKIGILRGKFKHGVHKKDNRVSKDSIVLISFRDYQDKNVDIIYVYNDEEARILKREGELMEDIEIQDEKNNEPELFIDFEEL